MKLTKHFVSLAAAAAAIAGCAGPDMTMRNPILAGALDQNHIVKAHGYAESQNGLPVGSMSDEAVIDTLDKSQICVNVSIHELAALDMTQAEVKLTTDTGSLLQPQMNAEPPTLADVPGPRAAHGAHGHARRLQHELVRPDDLRVAAGLLDDDDPRPGGRVRDEGPPLRAEPEPRHAGDEGNGAEDHDADRRARRVGRAGEEERHVPLGVPVS